ncbi:MAG: cytochrome c biogenesis protein CcdA [archaeon]
MKKVSYVILPAVVLMLVLASLFVSVLVSAAEIQSVKTTNIYYFWRPGCIHCANVEASGVLEKVANDTSVLIQRFSIAESDGREKFNYYTSGFNIPIEARGTPFLVIERLNGIDKQYSYLEGDRGGNLTIIENLESSIKNFKPVAFSDESTNKQKLTMGTIVVSALIDSINPCAFGVLIFLMISLLKIGSSKRALRAGLLYSFVVFVVYFLAGLGIFTVIQSFTSITHFIYLFAGVLVLVLGLWQFKDVLMPHIGPQLAISPKAKPIMERIINRGTIPAILLLGVVVSLFELPCTGGIYVAILTMMSINKTFALSYVLIYNLIFILPLIVITLIIYKGASPEKLQKWTSRERVWMKVASGVVMVALGLYILLV